MDRGVDRHRGKSRVMCAFVACHARHRCWSSARCTLACFLNPLVDGVPIEADGIRRDASRAHPNAEGLRAPAAALRRYGPATHSWRIVWRIRGEVHLLAALQQASIRAAAVCVTVGFSAGLVMALLVTSPQSTLAEVRRSLPYMTEPADALQDPAARRASGDSFSETG